MINKRMGTKIIAVLLAAVVALPSAGTVMAAEPAPAETVGEDTNEAGKSLWNSLFRSAYPKSDSTEEGKNTQSGTKTGTSTNTGIGEVKVALSVAVAEDIVYGDSLADKITVTATDVSNSTEVENFTEYELKYYDEEKNALENEPQNAGSYYVEAVVRENSDKYKGDASGQVLFAIAQKPVRLVLENQRIDINNKEEKLPDTYPLKLAEDSTLAYDEKFEEGYPQASYQIMKDGEVIPADALQAGKYILKVETDSVDFGLNVKKENYRIEPVADAELIAADMLKLEVTGDKKFQYGDFDDSKFLKSAVTAVNAQEKEEKLDEERLSLKYYDAEGNELTELPKNAGKYAVVAEYAYDEKDQKAGESDPFSFEITKREIEIKLDSFEIPNGEKLPTEEELNKKLTITGLVKEGDEEKLPYEDEWENAPRAYFEDEKIDTTADGEYKILFEAKLPEANYDLTVPEFATMTIAKPAGEEKDELAVKLEDVSVVYGDSVEDTVKAGITASDKEGAVELAADKYILKYYDAAGTELPEAPVDVAENGYQVKAVFEGDGIYKEAESELVKLIITKREISVKAKNYGIANGKPLPEKFDLEEVEKLCYEDQWAEGEPEAKLKDAITDTTVAGEYEIIVSAEVEEAKKGNYDIKTESGTLRIAALNPDTGKSINKLSLAEGTVTSKVYDGKAFENPIPREAVISDYEYAGEFEYIWSTSDGKAPKDAGSYKMIIRIPDSDPDWEGSLDVDLTIDKATVIATAKPVSTETYAGEPVKCNIEATGFIEGEKDSWIKKPTVKVVEGDVNKAAPYKVQAAGGDAGNNYDIKYGEAATVNVLAERKPVISSVKFGKKDTYTAKYTGEQIRPTVTVTCNYTNEKGKAATQKLKLNVDYLVSYSENVNVGTATITVQGIGEYAGVITKDFTITPKEMKKVTLSAVGDIKLGDTPALVVMDGNYELSPDDYEIIVKTEKNGSFKPLSEVTCGPKDILEKVELKVTAKEGSNYKGESSKKVKFNILGSEINATPIADITFDMTCLKIPAKGYTYNGKTQKPKVTVKGADGKKLKSSEFKVIYSGNVNAGLAKVQIVGLYNKKKNTGYYGVSEPVYFEIKQKSFKKVSVSSVAAIPKSGSLESITLTVKDGKRILTEGLDYWVDYSSIVDDETGQILSDKITVGQKYDVTLYAHDDGNYLTTGEDGKRVVKVKFGQLNLASKTAKYKAVLTSDSASGFSFEYNGVPLTQGVDYTVTKIKQDRKTGKYTVTIKAVKGKQCAYKGSRSIKNLDITPATNQ